MVARYLVVAWQVRGEATCLSAEFWTRWKAMTRATLVRTLLEYQSG